MSERVDEILVLINEKGEISIREIREKLNFKDNMPPGVFFLIKSGLIKLDKTREYVRLSGYCKKLIKENSNMR